MFKVFFILFIVVPLVELYVLIEVGSQIGALTTILLIILTALGGGLLMRDQGLRVIQQAQAAMAKGEAPERQAIEGVLVFIGGALLLLPGLVTDVLGLLLLIPVIRRAMAKRWLGRVGRARGTSYVHAEWTVKDPESGRVVHRHYVNHTDDDVIEGEVVDSDDKKS